MSTSSQPSVEQGPSPSTTAGEHHHAHHALAPHWSFTLTLLLLAVAFGFHASNTLDYVAEVMVAMGAVAASPTLVAITPSVRHRRRVNPRRRHPHHHHGVRLSLVLLAISAVCVLLSATVGLASWVTIAVLGLVVALLAATIYTDRAVPVEPEHLDGWSARLSHALHSPAFAGLLVFGGTVASILIAWLG